MKRKPWVVYPVLFALYPVLSLYSHNVTEVEPAQLVGPALALVSGVVIAWVVFWGLVRDPHKAALLSSAGMLLLFAFLGLKETAGKTLAPLVHLNSSRIALVLLVAGFSLAAYFVLRTRRQVATATPLMNWLGLILVLVPLISAVPRLGFHIEQHILRNETWPQASPAPQNKPDIYYIIVDAYGRQDILQQLYGLDNSEFLTWLEQTGFQVTRESYSNYSQTVLSLNSSLGCTYLDDLARIYGRQCRDRTPTYRLLRNTRALDFLKAQGYRLISFASGNTPTEWRQADEYLAPYAALGDFAQMLCEQTPLPTLFGWLGKAGAWSAYDAHRQRIAFTIEKLPEVALEPGPKFVFAHLLCPHPPFVFAPDGTPRQPAWRYGLDDASDFMSLAGSDGHKAYREGYRDQVLFLNQQLERVLPQIIENSAQPPVIVIQGDHGPGNYTVWTSSEQTLVQERFAIFNTLYLPGPDAPSLPANLTPVNTFRFILKHYFGVQLEALPNRCFFSTRSYPYDFIDVTDRLGEPIPAEYLAP